MDEMEVRKEFGRRIHALRERLGLSAEKFGKLIGVNGASICNWESCRCFLSQQSYDMLTDKHHELKMHEIEEMIVVLTKPGGKPKGLQQKPRKASETHASPAFPQVRNGKKEPEQLKLKIQEPPAKPAPKPAPKQPAEPYVDKQADIENLLVNSKTLVAMLAIDLKNKYGREEIIKRLRASGASDAFILEVIHEALP